MPSYRQGNYQFVVDSGFQPFSMQEMLVPFTMYKDAYEKSEAAYDELNQKAGDFEYLASTLPEGSRARGIYEGYANDLKAQAADLSHNGLSMNNRRALASLRQRYEGEIGRLASADEAMQEEKKLRRQMNSKDSSMLYATDNLSIDDFLDNSTPNLYNISGTELYTRGAAAGKSASSRIYNAGDEGSTLNGYFRRWVERNGYSPESINAFRANVSAIPELQQAADAILQERGVNENLSGANLERARQSVLNGIIDGAVYSEKVNPVRDPGVLSLAEKRADARQEAAETRAQEKWDREKKEYDIMMGIKYRQKKDEKGNPVVDEKGEPVLELNPEYLKGNFYLDPNANKWKTETQRSQTTAKEKAEAKEAAAQLKITNAKQTALQKVTDKVLANDNGFDLEYGGTEGVPADRVHYNYAGVLVNRGGKWYSGAIGEDNPTSGLISGSPMGSGSTENWLGNFSLENHWYRSNPKRRIMSISEINSLIADEEFFKTFQNQLDAARVMNAGALERKLYEHKKETEAGTYTTQDAIEDLYKEGYTDADYQLVEISSGKNKEYAIAVQK